MDRFRQEIELMALGACPRWRSDVAAWPENRRILQSGQRRFISRARSVPSISGMTTAHADTAVDRENIKHCSDNEVDPAEKEQGGNGAQMEDGHEDSRNPH